MGTGLQNIEENNTVTAKEEDIANLSSRVRTIETTKRQMVDAIVLLSERIRTLITYTEEQSNAIESTLLIFCKYAQKSFNQFFKQVYSESKANYHEFQKYHHDIIPKINVFISLSNLKVLDLKIKLIPY